LDETLQLIFLNAGGSRTTISLVDPAEGLTAQAVSDTMNLIIDRNLFYASNGTDLVAVEGARIVSRDVVELEVA